MDKKTRFFRPTWVEVDLAALRHNYRVLRKRLAAGTRVMVAVKANAYGHGIAEVGRALAGAGVDYLGVACVDEGIVLRRSGVRTPILNLGAFFPRDIAPMLAFDIAATVTDVAMARRLNAAARRQGAQARVHIKIDTGMGRLGFWHEEAEDLVVRLCGLKNLCVDGLYTHFPSADSDEAFTRSQIAVFCSLIDRLTVRGVAIPLKHTANSMAVVGFEAAHFNLVRPGLAVYGLHPQDALVGKIDLRPVLSFKTRIAHLKRVRRGRSVSYGRTYVARRDTLIATLPVGYGDGYNRLLSNRGSVLIRGRRCPVVGVVCMDQTMVDVGRLPGVRVGEEVVLIGRQQDARIRAEEIAGLCHTIPYEVICWISPRVPRVYVHP
ncbi:MAG: alanine racemase [Deltaproteobacteria bacterium]